MALPAMRIQEEEGKRAPGELITPPDPLLDKRGDKDSPSLSRLKGWQRAVMAARLGLINELEQRMQGQGTTFNRAARGLLDEAEAGALSMPLRLMLEDANHRRGEGGRSVSAATLYRWWVLWRERGKMGLVPEDKEGGQGVPPWLPEFLRFYRLPSKPSIPHAIEMMAEYRRQNGLSLDDMPSYVSVTRALKRMSSVDVQRGRKQGSDLRAMRGYCVRDKSQYEPLDIVVADGHSFKAKVAHPVHGKPFNPEVEGIIDVATRVCLGWSAGLAESAMIVADAIRHAVTVDERKPYGGCFGIFYSDRGAGNRAKIISKDVTGILARVGATFKTGIPGNPQGRGIIERLQGSLWVRAAKELPTFSGSGMDSSSYRKTMKIVERDIKEVGSSSLLISWGQFLEFCEGTINRYNNRPHSALPKIVDVSGHKRHMTPLELWQDFVQKGWSPQLLGKEEIVDLFRPQVEVITRRCMVQLFGNSYYHKELEHYSGERVYVNYDIHDPNSVWVRDRQQRLICEAVFEGNKRHYYPVSAVDMARQNRQRNRIRLIEQKKAEIEDEAVGVVDVQQGIPDEVVIIEDGRASGAMNCAPTTTTGMPFFGDDTARRYEWHLKNGFRTEEDLRFKVEFEKTDSYRMLQSYWQ